VQRKQDLDVKEKQQRLLKSNMYQLKRQMERHITEMVQNRLERNQIVRAWVAMVVAAKVTSLVSQRYKRLQNKFAIEVKRHMMARRIQRAMIRHMQRLTRGAGYPQNYLRM
jgi:hypothetical protein